jgi:hypothetical protein
VNSSYQLFNTRFNLQQQRNFRDFCPINEKSAHEQCSRNQCSQQKSET